MIDILILLLVPALKAVDGGSRNPLHIFAALVAWPLDIIIAHTTWAATAGFPREGEWTISHTLERLCVTPGADQQWYIELSKKINRVSPTGGHIKSVLGIRQEGK